MMSGCASADATERLTIAFGDKFLSKWSFDG
jgi:hypothetical protein